MVVSILVAAVAAMGPVVERERDSADRASIARWYDWGDKARIAAKKYVGCEGALEYDVEVPETGWYEFWQGGCPSEWGRKVAFDGKSVSLAHSKIVYPHYRTYGGPGADRKSPFPGYSKDFNVFLEKGRHTVRCERNEFPGALFSWKLVKAPERPETRAFARMGRTVWRAREKVAFEVIASASRKLVCNCRVRNAVTQAEAATFAFEIPAAERPRTFTVAVPSVPEGVYTVEVVPSAAGPVFQGDLGLACFVVVDTDPIDPKRPVDYRETLVAEVDCVATPPLRDKDGASRVVRRSFGAYRESSGRGSNDHWACDGFSYALTIPDCAHTYRLEVDYPNDDFRSSGFFINDGSKARDGGVCLTGGVETGGQYALDDTLRTHTAYFYPKGTNLWFAAVNLNHGSRAACSRVRVYRIDSALPASPLGRTRGRLAGQFFEENGRWNRFFGQGHGKPEENTDPVFSTLLAMKRWGDWNRFTGENLFSPTVVGYGAIEYPSCVLNGSGMPIVDYSRMLALVAEKYGQSYIPHVFHQGDPVFAAALGIRQVEVVEKKNGGKKRIYEFKHPEYVTWSKDGSTVIPWMQYSLNPIHPRVQRYLVDVVGEIADGLADSPAFKGVAVRVPLNWQFSGLTGLNSADYGYGDYTVGEFEKDTGIRVPGKAGDPKRFAERHAFLMGPEHEAAWLRWRHVRMLAYYRAVRDRIRKARPDAQLLIMWWPNENGRPVSRQLAECGISPEDFRDEEGISFYSMGILWGRRYFTPYGAMKRESLLHDPATYEMTLPGLRPMCVYSEYYEMNRSLNWPAFGAPDYCGFDALEPSGDDEMRNFALPLATADTACFLQGGNGWIFGTPERVRPFMREYQALPTDRFSPVPGVRADPVEIRAAETKEGSFFYAVNVSDRPVRATVRVKGKLLSAADGRETPATFDLPAYGLRSFELKRGLLGLGAKPCVTGVTVETDAAARARAAKLAETARDMRRRLAEGRLASAWPVTRRNRVLALFDAAIASAAAGGTADIVHAFRDPDVVGLFDLDCRWPAHVFEADERIGGFPPDAKDMPKLSFERAWGGAYSGFAAPSASVPWKDGVIEAYRTSVELSQEFSWLVRRDAAGKVVQARLLRFEPTPASDARGRYSRGLYPQMVHLTGLGLADGRLRVNFQGRVYLYDPETLLPVDGAVTRLPQPAIRGGQAYAKAPAAGELTQATQLKVRDGLLWYLSGGKLMALDPKSGAASVRLAPDCRPSAFAFEPDGSVVLAHHTVRHERGQGFTCHRFANGAFEAKGEILNGGKLVEKGPYSWASDLDISEKGFLFRSGSVCTNACARFNPTTGAVVPEPGTLAGLRAWSGAFPFTGYHRDADGNLFVADPSASRVVKADASGRELLRLERTTSQRGAASQALRAPVAVTTDAKGRIYVADAGADAIFVFAKDGRYLGRFGESGTPADAPEGRFQFISGLAVVGNRLYVADLGNARIVSYVIR